jgi:hypothetical protein
VVCHTRPSKKGSGAAPAPDRGLGSIREALPMLGLDWDRLEFAVFAAILSTKLTMVLIRRCARRGTEPEGAEK